MGITEYSLQKLRKTSGGSHYVIVGNRVDGNFLHVFLTAESPIVLTITGEDLADVEKQEAEEKRRETMRRSMRRASSAVKLINAVGRLSITDTTAPVMQDNLD